MTEWKPAERNYDGIQFEGLRKQIDGKFDIVHDELSDCYYNGKPFRTYGMLDKATFDKLHGLIFLMRDVEFHTENLKLNVENRIPEKEYNAQEVDKDGNIIKTKSDFAQEKINVLSLEGIVFVI